MSPRLLDLFCGAGGCTRGYQLAGFHVTGVDLHPQPNYCGDDFIQADGLDFLGDVVLSRRWERPIHRGENGRWPNEFDAIHASPPCQAYSGMRGRWPDRTHPDLVAATRDLLVASGLPYVIENVVGAPLINPTQLCGSGLGLPLKRHRLFETSFPMMSPGCAHGMWPKRYRIRQHGREFDTAFCYVFGGGQAGQPVATWREAMGIDWMTVDELSQAIPPAMTEHVGGYLLQAIRGREAG